MKEIKTILVTLALLALCANGQHPTTYALNDYPLSSAYPITISWTMDATTSTAYFKAELDGASAASSSLTIGLYAPDAPSGVHFTTGTAFVDTWSFGVTTTTGDVCFPSCGFDGRMPRDRVSRAETQNLGDVDVQHVGGKLIARWSRVYSTADANDWVIVPAENVMLIYGCHQTEGIKDDAADVMPEHQNSPSRCAGETQVQLGWTDADVTNGNAQGGFASPSGDFRAAYGPNANGDGILFEIEADTTGWLSLGWAPLGAQAHDGTDMVVAWVTNAGALVTRDTRSTSFSQPGTDAVDNVTPGTGTEASGVTSVSFERLYVTGDTAGDVDIVDGPMEVHWAYAASDSPAAKHIAAGVVEVNLQSTTNLTPPPPPGPGNGTATASTSGGGFASFDGAFVVRYAVSPDASSITFNVDAATSGWVGFGFSLGARDHLNTEMWVCSVAGDGTVTALDTYSTARALPASDDALGGAQDLTDVSGSITNGRMQVRFTRLIETGTPGDLTIPDGFVNLQYGLGSGGISGASFTKHSSAGMGSVNFFSDAFVTEKAPPDFELDAGTGLIFTLLAIFFVLVVYRWVRKGYKYYKLRKVREKALAEGTDVPLGTSQEESEWDVQTSPPMASNLPADRRGVYFVGSSPVTTTSPYGGADEEEDCGAFGGAVGEVVVGGRARAMYEFCPQGADELPLYEGDVVTITEIYDDGWAYARAGNGAEGAIPVSFVEGLVSRPAPPAPGRALPPPPPGSAAASASSGGATGGRAPPPQAPKRANLAKGQASLVSTIAFRLRHTRIPGTDISVGDTLLACAFLFVNIGWIWIWNDELWYVRDSLGNVLAANSFMVALPATRNSVLVWLFGVHFDRIIMFHRWLGRWVIILGVLHFAWYLSYWGEEKALDTNTEFNRASNLYGFFSLFSALLIGATSISWIRRKRFQAFFWSHYLFVAYYCLACYHTAKFRPWAIAAAVVYGLDRLIRFFWGLYPRRATLTVKDGNMLQVRFAKHPLARHRPGQYVFLNFPQLAPLEWHPFTLSSGPYEETCEVHIKALGNHTSALLQKASLTNTLWVRCDGPYGRLSLNHKRFPALILCGGGVGVTPLIALLKTLYHVNVTPAAAAKKPISATTTNVYFVWAVPTEQVVSWFADVFDEVMEKAGKSGYPNLRLFIHVTRQDTVQDPSLYCGRPNIPLIFDDICNELGQAAIPRAAVYTCGPTHLVSSTWDASMKHTSPSGLRLHFHSEEFNF